MIRYFKTALIVLVGLMCFKGAYDLWKQVGHDAAAFNAAKTWAVAGCCMALIFVNQADS